MNLSHKHHAESHLIECKPIVPDNLLEQEQAEKELILLQQQQEEEKEEEKIAHDLDVVLEEKDILLTMISDLTEQINQLRDQMKAKPEVNYYTLTKQGKDVQPMLKQVKRVESKEQQDNKEAYYQNYHE